jgi:16S rRNA G527 N7-methylase RsmG
VVVCRAFSALDDFAKLTLPFISPFGRLLAMKGDPRSTVRRHIPKFFNLPGDLNLYETASQQLPLLTIFNNFR